MKDTTYSNPYATNSGGKIDAPAKKKDDPKSSKISNANGDMRK